MRASKTSLFYQFVVESQPHLSRLTDTQRQVEEWESFRSALVRGCWRGEAGGGLKGRAWLLGMESGDPSGGCCRNSEMLVT